MRFELNWFDENDDDELAGEVDLPVTEDEVRLAFGLSADEWSWDCLLVTSQQVEWLQDKTGISIELDRYKYFVDVS